MICFRLSREKQAEYDNGLKKIEQALGEINQEAKKRCRDGLMEAEIELKQKLDAWSPLQPGENEYIKLLLGRETLAPGEFEKVKKFIEAIKASSKD